MNSQKEKFLNIFNSIDFQNITDHPNILIAASFWDRERYCAAEICYKFMRLIDDMIDNHKAGNLHMSDHDKMIFSANVDEWLKMTITSLDCNPLQKELRAVIERFRIPLWTLEAFARSMRYDINHDGFTNLQGFLEYANGASVAPASIFVHLSGLRKQNDGSFKEPPFDVKVAATPCAIFSYLVHIIRDFQKDQLSNLNYFADDLIDKHGLTRQTLRDIASGSPVTPEFRNLIKEYYSLANQYKLQTTDVIDKIGHLVEVDSRLSLEIIFDLYLMTFERIDIEKGNFTSSELTPAYEEIKKRVHGTILKFQD